MKYPVFSIRDRHTGFMTPTVDYNENTAKRNFAKAINSETGIMNFEPGDFDLYKIGEFDSETGNLVSENIPVLVVSGLSIFGANVK